MPALIEVRGVHFAYADQPVLEDIDLTVEPGDFLAILGPNGSGKSTLLRIMLGLLRPVRGQVRLFGQEVSRFRQWWRVGYVPQRAAAAVDQVFPVSVEEVVSFGLLSRKRFPRLPGAGDREAVRRALALVEMEDHLGRRLASLSGGQQQRVFIARAIVSEPEVLLLDEPTTGVDAATQERFYDLLGELNARGLTIVIVTHDIGIVNRHVKQVACLNRRLIYHGTHEEFCSSPTLKRIVGDHHLVIHRH